MRKYVRMIAVFSSDGQITPRAILLENGDVVEIRQVCEIRRAASMGAGGFGMRYTCISNSREIHVFFENNRWFIDSEMSLHSSCG